MADTDKEQVVISGAEVKTTRLTRSEQRKKNRLDTRGRKKADSSPGAGASGNFISRSVDFFKEAKEELLRVVWPTRKETVDSTWRLLVLVALVGVYLGLVDSILSKIMGLFI